MKRVLVTLIVVAVFAATGLLFVFLRSTASPAARSGPAEGSVLVADTTPPEAATEQFTQPRRGKRVLQDPDARDALRLVGADAVAEEYWFTAINNPSLPAKEREDLIEDLNEEGFADPKHPTEHELPLIMNRLAILEQLTAMDDVNAAAIKEAHKDLSKMRDRVLRPRNTVR